MKKKNNRVSNNILVILLGVSILISIFGTWVTLSYVDQITGAVTVPASSNLTITGTTNCVFNDNQIDFGSMAFGANKYSENSTIANWFIMENNGNYILNVSAYVNTEELFTTDSAPTANWQLKCNSSQTTDCRNTTYTKIQTTLPLANILIPNLSPIDAQDEVTFGVNVTIPSGEPAGAKNGTITFECLPNP